MATETKGSVGKVKSSNQDGSSKAKVDVSKKKIDSSGKQKTPDSKQNRSVSIATKTEVPISKLCYSFRLLLDKSLFFSFHGMPICWFLKVGLCLFYLCFGNLGFSVSELFFYLPFDEFSDVDLVIFGLLIRKFYDCKELVDLGRELSAIN